MKLIMLKVLRALLKPNFILRCLLSKQTHLLVPAMTLTKPLQFIKPLTPHLSPQKTLR